MGTWTDAVVLEKQWSGLRLYVMDCEFGKPGSENGTHNFLINTKMLADGNLHLCKLLIPPLISTWLTGRNLGPVSGWDKKILCAGLNFCLFRYAEVDTLDVMFGGSVWIPSRKKKENKGR